MKEIICPTGVSSIFVLLFIFSKSKFKLLITGCAISCIINFISQFDIIGIKVVSEEVYTPILQFDTGFIIVNLEELLYTSNNIVSFCLIINFFESVSDDSI